MNDTRFRDRVIDIIDEMGLRFGVNSHDQGRAVAEVIFSEHDPDVCTDGLTLGASQVIRERNSATRKSANAVMSHLAAVEDQSIVVGVEYSNAMLDWVVPGPSPQPLRKATPSLLISARKLVQKQKVGIEKTEQKLDFLIEATADQPQDETIESLIIRGSLMIQSLMWDEGRAA
jgi:hypothetical protein